MKRPLSVLLLCATTMAAGAQISLANAYRINLQSPEGLYISATRNFVPSLQANVEKPGMYEFFVLEDVNGGTLESGDQVRLYAHSGYVAAGESNDLLLASPRPSEMQEFQLERSEGPGTIRNYDKVYFKTADGSAIVQEGNGTLKVGSGSPLAIALSVADVNPAIAEGFSQDWKAGWGITFDNSPQGAVGRKLQSASTFSSLSGFRGNHAQTTIAATPSSSKAPTQVTKNTTPKPTKPAPQLAVKQPAKAPAAPAQPALPASLPLGYYKCYVDHVSNLAMAGYFTLKPGGKYVFHGFDPEKRIGTEGAYNYDAKTGRIVWLSGAWKTNNYYGLYSLDATYGDRIYLIPEGSDYSACKCFLQH